MSAQQHAMQLQRFASWMSVFPRNSYSSIRLHEIAWMHNAPAHVLTSPPLDRYLLIYILSGGGQIILSGKRYSFHRGNAVFFHMQESFRTTAGSEGVDYISIQFSSALADILYNYIHAGNAESQVVFPGGPDIPVVAEQLYNFACGKWSSRADIEISAALYRLLGLIHTQPAGKQQTEDALLYIHQHYMEELPLEQLAACCRMSLYHFIRCFKRDTGRTPHTYIQEYRMQKAKELLIQTQLSIADVASFVGYADPSHFAKLFSQSAGCLPREYKKLYQA